MKKNIFLYLCILFVSIEAHEGLKIFVDTFIEYSKINEILEKNNETILSIPEKCFYEELDFKLQKFFLMIFRKKLKSNILGELFGLKDYLDCFIAFGPLLSIPKLIKFDDIIVLGIRLLGVLDEIETYIINEYHNEDSDYFSIAKTSGTIFNRLFHIMKNSTAKI